MSFIGTLEKKSEGLVSKRPPSAPWSREAGQGTLEYIMVLTVIVILFLTVIWQFNDAFRSYAERFFDGYVACLLETGELPGRGGECSTDMPRFKVADGKPLVTGPLGDGSGTGTGGTGAGGSGGSGSGSGGKDGNSGSDSKAGGGKGGSGGGGGGNESVAASGGSGGPVTPVGSIGNRGKGRARSTAVGQAKNAGEEGGGDSLIAPMAGMTGGVNDTASGRAKKTALDRGFGYWGQQEDEEAQSSKAPVQSVSNKNEAGDNLKAKTAKVDPTRKTASVRETEDSGFSLGYLFRIILIAGIIIAIVVFMGGQLLQISKSYEK